MTSFFKNTARFYVHYVTALNHAVGIFAAYLLLMLLAILMYSVISAGVFNKPGVWVMEMAQFTMAAYYLLGGGLSIREGAHVRMDFLYEKWGARRKLVTDCLTIGFVVFYLIVMVKGGISSSSFALEYKQRNHTAWAPYMAPIKIIMTTGMFLMLLQVVAEFLRDLAKLGGWNIEYGKSETAAGEEVPLISTRATRSFSPVMLFNNITGALCVKLYDRTR
ncbi:MAG: TRAP transporter small permease [Opitutaceae bacterium]|jgi:TRAP-type mannitol/chloroaromatic compound transport system permease small subunit|nr:TRAP transporter small permease [Opitutaceae bacterium]